METNMAKRELVKFMGGAFVIVMLIFVVLVGRKPRLINAQHINLSKIDFSGAISTSNNPYGQVLQNIKSVTPNAKVEHIALQVPKSKGSDQNIVRYGRLVSYPNAEATVLICHGFMCDKFDVGFLRNMFVPGRFNVMTFDFRAHGENIVGQRCTFGRDEALDVLTAAHFLKNHDPVKNKPVIVYGFSMGAVAAIEAQSSDETLFSAMILDCPFDSSENIIKKNLENIQFTFLGYDFSVPACSLLQRYAFHPYVQSMIKGILKTIGHLEMKDIDIRIYPISPATSIAKVHVPCFFIHCKNDEKVPVDAVKSLYNGADTNYKVLWLTNGRWHYDSLFYNPEKYIDEVRGFLDHVVRNRSQIGQMQKIVEDPDELLAQI